MSKRWRPRRRVFPINYAADRINVYRGPNRDVLAVLHKTVRSTRGRKDQMEPVENNTWLKEIPKTRGLRERAWFDEEFGVFRLAQPTPSQEKAQRVQKINNALRDYLVAGKDWVLTSDRSKLLRLWGDPTGSKWGVDTMHHFKIADDGLGKLKVFFAGKQWRIVEEIGSRGFISGLYTTKDRALDALRKGQVRWEKELYILPSAT